MRKIRIACSGLAIIFAAAVTNVAQNRTPAMDRLAEAIERLVQEKHPEWTLERIEPVYKGENVIIDQWTAPRTYVRVSVVPYRSAAEAKEALQNLARNMKAERALGVGEEGYSWRWGSNETALRKGRFTVHVSAAIDVEDDPDSAGLDDTQKAQRKADKQKKLSLEFAAHAVSKVDLP